MSARGTREIVNHAQAPPMVAAFSQSLRESIGGGAVGFFTVGRNDFLYERPSSFLLKEDLCLFRPFTSFAPGVTGTSSMLIKLFALSFGSSRNRENPLSGRFEATAPFGSNGLSGADRELNRGGGGGGPLNRGGGGGGTSRAVNPDKHENFKLVFLEDEWIETLEKGCETIETFRKE